MAWTWLRKVVHSKALWQVLACSAVLVLAAWGTRTLVALKKPPATVEVKRPGPLVNATTVHFSRHDVVVQGYGQVEALDRLSIVPQVSGKVVRVSRSLVEGGFFEAGQVLLEIEAEDYQLAVEAASAQLEQARLAVSQAQATVQTAQTALVVEQAEAQAAVAEWQAEHGQQPVPDLVARRPQLAERAAAVEAAKAALASARAQVTAARTTLARAKLDLSRTRLAMPFAGRVLEENVEVGQYLVAGQPVGQVYRTDRVQVRVPLENEKLAWFDVPLTGRADRGAVAEVSARFAGKTVRWLGRVVRTSGRIDERSRLVDVMVEVQAPFDAGPGGVPLTPGMFVEVAITGRSLEHVAAIPRYALRAGDTVWQVVDGRLKVTAVKVVRLDHQSAWIGQGLEEGAVIITDHLDSWTEGMRVRPALEGQAQPSGERSDPGREEFEQPGQAGKSGLPGSVWPAGTGEASDDA